MVHAAVTDRSPQLGVIAQAMIRLFTYIDLYFCIAHFGLLIWPNVYLIVLALSFQKGKSRKTANEKIASQEYFFSNRIELGARTSFVFVSWQPRNVNGVIYHPM